MNSNGLEQWIGSRAHCGDSEPVTSAYCAYGEYYRYYFIQFSSSSPKYNTPLSTAGEPDGVLAELCNSLTSNSFQLIQITKQTPIRERETVIRPTTPLHH